MTPPSETIENLVEAILRAFENPPNYKTRNYPPPYAYGKIKELVTTAIDSARVGAFNEAIEQAAGVADSDMPLNYPKDQISGCKSRTAERILALKKPEAKREG